jgi:hypothetical protein
MTRMCRLRGAACAAILAALPLPLLAGGTDLSSYYRNMEAVLVAQGALRVDRAAGETARDAQSLARDFLDVALFTEYGSGLSTGQGSRRAKPLLRWEDPVRMQVIFGQSVDPTQRQADRRAIRRYAERLARVTGHPVTQATSVANFHVLVVNEDERRSLAGQLPALIPGISDWMMKTVARMRPDHLCMVVAEPHADRRKGYRRAVAIVRAEHPERMRASCIEEELAQGMGLPNDCPTAVPSIFNDDQEYALLTARDEILLRMLYHRDLASGMRLEEAEPKVRRLSERLIAGR